VALGGWYPTFRKEHSASIFRVKQSKNNGLFLDRFNPLNAKLNPTCHLLALLGARPIFHVSKVRVNREAEGTTETSGPHATTRPLTLLINVADTTTQTHRRMCASSVRFSVKAHSSRLRNQWTVLPINNIFLFRLTQQFNISYPKSGFGLYNLLITTCFGLCTWPSSGSYLGLEGDYITSVYTIGIPLVIFYLH
jgi:hypothetical protein